MNQESSTLKTTSKFRWLHFSDIHVGLSGQRFLWPRYGTSLLDDLRKTIIKNGPVDLVVFSGDLAQAGKKEEFERFDEIINEILDAIALNQTRPQIITVPGNHDLMRPDPLSSGALALKQYWTNENLREFLWEMKGKEHTQFINRLFREYVAWRKNAIARGVHLPPHSDGLLPGDASYTLIKEEGSLGIAALNSTWLQIGGDNYEQQLHVDIRQLLSITDNKPDNFVRDHDVNLLVTHHPRSWLHSSSPSSWDNDINPAGRFDLHLFGHMHVPDASACSQGGSLPRRSAQAASLFGLEKYSDNKYERIHGYSIHEIAFDGANRTLTVWPRRLIAVAAGNMKLVPDSSLDIDEVSGSFEYTYQIERSLSQQASQKKIHVDETEVDHAIVPTPEFSLELLQNVLPKSDAHKNVRRVEQEACLQALSSKSIVWIVADWGMGSEGFLATICDRTSIKRERVYKFDLSEYSGADSYLDKIQARYKTSFQVICERISELDAHLILFDDIPSSLSEKELTDLERLVEAVADFSVTSTIVLLSKRNPQIEIFETVTLKALDEADVAVYARDSTHGGEHYTKAASVWKLFRHTDGVPIRLDSALKDLELISIDDLINNNPDYSQNTALVTSAPSALVDAINTVRRSEERSDQRAYNLLLALSAMPHGEQLSRLRRFMGVHPFGPDHARILQDRSLIEVQAVTSLESAGGIIPSKIIVVPRMVREYIRDSVNHRDAASIDEKVLDLYFGSSWREGDISGSASAKRLSQALCNSYELRNACTIVVRALKRVYASSDQTEISSFNRLSLAFVRVLGKGSHYKTAVDFCDDIIQISEEYPFDTKQLVNVNYERARSLRMLGRIDEAIASFQALDQCHLNKEQRQHTELGLALCLEKQSNALSIQEAAKRTIAVAKHTGAALQAEVILAEQIADYDKRQSELNRLLVLCRKKKMFILEHNILLSIAKDLSKKGVNSDDILREIIVSARKSNDFYNSARTVVDLCEQSDTITKLSSLERDRLIETYHFLYNERLFDLFDRCHQALWRVFKHSKDWSNLLNLFRHSSFIWRLNGREDKETKYLKELSDLLKRSVIGGSFSNSRDTAYYVVRVSIVLGVNVKKGSS